MDRTQAQRPPVGKRASGGLPCVFAAEGPGPPNSKVVTEVTVGNESNTRTRSPEGIPAPQYRPTVSLYDTICCCIAYVQVREGIYISRSVCTPSGVMVCMRRLGWNGPCVSPRVEQWMAASATTSRLDSECNPCIANHDQKGIVLVKMHGRCVVFRKDGNIHYLC